MTFQQLKQNYINGLLKTNAFIVKGIDEEPFTLRSGKQSYMFLDHSRIAGSPTAFRAWVDVMSALLQDIFGDQEIAVCNVDSKISSQLVGAIAYNLKLPQVVYKSTALTQIEQGTKQQFSGLTSWNKQIVLLDDVASGNDGTAKKIADELKKLFPEASVHIVVGFVREIQKTTYPMHHILTRNELLNIVGNDLTKAQQEAIAKEIKL